ncbi:MAG TPA: ribosome biogenesis/translation initiation ATPase RLI [Candidatus Thermoplasmatota archaeon]|nr:ribosome biogenesis/translation initiation ATPase RLI [Candidatus Thermoplasmatota archaeon]
MRVAVVERDRCQPRKCQYECINFCPVVRQGVTDCIKPGDGGKAVISEPLCIGCGICVNKCPFDAIHIINLPEQLENDIMHRYGENGFALFRLPVPKAGQVTGILGPNGIGKSTAIKILAGQMVPNLGNWQQEGTWQAVADKYAGTELGDYLAKVKAGQIKAAFKPQYVDRIPKMVSGVVRDLLKKSDDLGRLDKVAADLEITPILDREISKLSGGELQRTALAAVLLKNADVYFIDEPSSYLDIDQRLKVARLIRTLAEKEGKAVVVIEHDLAVLDFLTDNVHITYGKEGAYGVVALPRPVRTAINTYVQGYMKEENVRFRDTKIEFELHPPRHEWMGALAAEFEGLKKVQGEFTLETLPGQIHYGEVVGIVGPNGTGKTTFVKMLAGVEKPTEGAVKSTVTVAYKPQYLKSEYDGSVQELFFVEVGAKWDSTWFQTEIARPLELERLLNKTVNTLSGGELQRVAIALCLAKEADLYLLDEPSAYLDVDQRMVAAKVIRRAMEKGGRSALVVDHDVYFMDVIADSIMVFGGKSGIRGKGEGPFDMREGMNRFLKHANITFRRDKETLRPRVNKEDSRLDREQKSLGEYYYMVASD